MQRTLTLAAFAALCTLALTCKKEPPVVPEPTLSLTAVDASCIEAWLKVTTTQVPATVRLLRDGQRVVDRRLITPDSLVIDEGLLPKRAYTYVLQRLAADSSVVETSAGVQVTTMDTTSHNFTWQIDTLGDGAGSVLYDVAIINDTLAYAVGEIYKRDSMGNWDPLPYNLAKWNGQQWELNRVTVVYRGSPITPPLNSIFAFSDRDIWLSSGVPVHGNGQTWTQYHLFDMGVLTQNDGSINKIWGSSSTNLWFVGNRGTIVHYDGATWRRIESGTGLPINDIFGSAKSTTGELEILCVASNQFINQGKRLLRITNTEVTQLPDSGLSWALNTIWHVAGRRYFVGGDGLYQSRTLGLFWVRDQSFPPYYKTAIRGTGLNEVVVVGAFGMLLVYNGYRWQSFHHVTNLPSGAYGRVELKGSILVAVGGIGGRAVALIGRRAII